MKELDEIEARWERVRDHNDAGSPEYTELVDALMLDVPSLVAALRAVLELHVGDGESQGYTPDCYRVIPSACSQCGTLGEYEVPWPCATVRAIESALASSTSQVSDEQVEAAAKAMWWHQFPWVDREAQKKGSIEEDMLRLARTALEAAAEVGK